jgi:cytochrome c553
MKLFLLPLGVVVGFAIISPAHAAGDVQAGKTRAAGCVGCHGANGQGVAPNPPVAGMSEEKFIQAMNDYKSGKRANPVMKALASSLSNQDMANLAAYYSSLKQ